MDLITRMFIRSRKSVARNTPGQTLTEYTLIFAAIVIVTFGSYRALGNNIGSLAKGVISSLTSA
jgi:hypothetical protein